MSTYPITAQAETWQVSLQSELVTLKLHGHRFEVLAHRITCADKLGYAFHYEPRHWIGERSLGRWRLVVIISRGGQVAGKASLLDDAIAVASPRL